MGALKRGAAALMLMAMLVGCGSGVTPTYEAGGDAGSAPVLSAAGQGYVSAGSGYGDSSDYGYDDAGSSDQGSSDQGSMDHGSMDHGSMDHGSMDHGSSEEEAAPATAELTVVLADFKIEPREITISLGTPVKITVVNRGQNSHSFNIGGEYGIRSERLPPGGSQVMEFVADTAGRFEMICGVPGHKDAGMVATLIVN